MGQNTSTAFQNSSAPLFPRRRNTSPPPRPSAPPTIPTPKTPTYVVPENKVLPNGAEDMSNARKLLRPVSQELTKFHPEYADIFQYDPDLDEFEAGDDSSLDRSMNASVADKENSRLNSSANSTLLASGMAGQVNYSPDGSLPNGRLPNASQKKNGHVRNNSVSSPNIAGNVETTNAGGTNLRRSQSVDRDRTPAQKVPRHKRQTSLTSRISLQDTVILEDPREHLYNAARYEPFSNYQPSTGSLPLQSSFDMDYSMNLTYAQLADYRRQKRATELEEKTGRKLEDLGAELKASNTVPKSPFDRQNLGGKSSTHSISTGSSETGVSKSKKKKAPAPPPPGPVSRDRSPGGFSLTTEPPADYDMEDTSPGSPQRRSRSLQRNMSSASRKSSKSPAPQPIAKSHSVASLPTSAKTTTTQPVPSANIPPPPPLKGLGSNASANKANADTKPAPGQASVQRSMSAAKEQLEKLKKLEELLKKPTATESSASADRSSSVGPSELNKSTVNNDTNVDTKGAKTINTDNGNAIAKSSEGTKDQTTSSSVKPTESLEISVSDLNSSQTGEDVSKPVPDSMTGVKRMSSLLQHDIVLAAQARGAKIVKAKSPPVYEKPKDASEMFREELAKAASEREERRKEASNQNIRDEVKDSSTPSTPQENRNIVFQSSCLKVTKKPARQFSDDQSSNSSSVKEVYKTQNTETDKPEPKAFQSETKAKSDGELFEECIAAAESVDLTKRPSLQSEDMSISSSNTSQRVFSPDWTPEQDLDSDDDILDENLNVPERKVSTEGFKASIIPPKIKELKNSKKDKKKRRKEEKVEQKREVLESSMDEKTKFGSIRKFRKSVHEGVRNAFGSISKASGKLLKKQKSHDFLDIREPIPQSPPPADSEDERPQTSRNANWALSNGQRGSLRRTASEGFIDHSYHNEVSESESSGDSDDDEVRDIDFAAGIDDLPKHHKSSKRPEQGEQDLKAMKRAGVAYVSQKGQIIVLPESQTVRVDENGHIIHEGRDSDGHAPKIHKKKNKKFTFESTLKKKEKHRMEESVAHEIREKERQIEMERLKQQEMEREFRRLRDLETQERLQRLQTASLRDQISLMQQQQLRQGHNELNNNSVSLSSLNNFNAIPNGSAVHPPYVSSDHLSSPQYLVNGNGVVSSSGYLNSPTHYGNNVPLASQQRYSMPLFSTTVIGQPTSHASMATTTDPANYTSHSAPMVGGPTISGGVGGSTYPNLSSQDKAYLSDYMRMMGVPPPSNQQQWSVLLSTISCNSPAYPTFVPYQGQNGFSGLGNGPDLSQLFGSGKTFDSTTADSKKQQLVSLLAGQQAFQARDVAALQRVPNDAMYLKSMHLLNTGDPYPQTQLYEHPSHTVSEHDHRFDNGAAPTTTITNQSSLAPTVIKTTDNNNGVVSVKVPDYRDATPEDRMDYLTSTNATVHGQTGAPNEIVTHQKAVPSPVLPAKVYGPIGFRPVSFHANPS